MAKLDSKYRVLPRLDAVTDLLRCDNDIMQCVRARLTAAHQVPQKFHGARTTQRAIMHH